MSDPSLLNIPYRFKPGTLYSQIPDSGLGDFVVSRSASNAATRVNAQGFIETVADNVPRLDYPLGGIANGCPALLVEPSAQNLALQSQTLDVGATWVPENGAIVSPNSTATLSPDGLNTAEILTLVSGATNALYQTIPMTSGTTYTASIFLKNIALTSGQTFLFSTANQESTINQINCTVDLANGTITSAVVGAGVTVSNVALDNYGNGWYRARFTFSFAVGGTAARLRIRQGSVVGYNTAFYVWGAQLETGPIATSYIPTTTAPITRGTETISKTGVSSLIGQTEGTIYAEVDLRAFASSGARRIVNIRVDGNNLLSLEVSTAGTSVDFVAISGGSSVTATASGITTGIYKIAVGYNSAASGTVLYVNGTLRDTRTIAIPNLSAAVFGYGTRAHGAAGTQFNDRIRAVALLPTRLTNAELQALTT